MRERAGRSTDARNHAEALATVEARAKTVTEELREQVSRFFAQCNDDGVRMYS